MKMIYLLMTYTAKLVFLCYFFLRLIEHRVTNTSLRRRVILEKCEPEMVGNGICNCACQHPITGNDGGDCDVVTSEAEAVCAGAAVGDGKWVVDHYRVTFIYKCIYALLLDRL